MAAGAGEAQLFPIGHHQEANQGDTESNEDVPVGEGCDRQATLRQVVHDDPQEADDEEAEHDRLEPHRVRILGNGLAAGGAQLLLG